MVRQIKAKEKLASQSSIGQYRSITKAGIAKWVQNFKTGQIEITKVSDLKHLIEIALMLDKK